MKHITKGRKFFRQFNDVSTHHRKKKKKIEGKKERERERERDGTKIR